MHLQPLCTILFHYILSRNILKQLTRTEFPLLKTIINSSEKMYKKKKPEDYSSGLTSIS